MRTSSRVRCRADLLFSLLDLFIARFGDSTLDRAGQFFLAFQLDHGVIAGLAYRSVPCDFAGFDGAPANLLPPGDVGGPRRVRPKQTTSSSSAAAGPLPLLPLCQRRHTACLCANGARISAHTGGLFCRGVSAGALRVVDGG